MALITTMLSSFSGAIAGISIPTITIPKPTLTTSTTYEEGISLSNFYATPIANQSKNYESIVSFKVHFPKSTSRKTVTLSFTSSTCSSKVLETYSVPARSTSYSSTYTYSEFNGTTNPKFTLVAMCGVDSKTWELIPKVQTQSSYQILSNDTKRVSQQIASYSQSYGTTYLDDLIEFKGFEISSNPVYGYVDLYQCSIKCSFSGTTYAPKTGLILLTLSGIGDMFHEIGDYAGFDFTNLELKIEHGSDGYYHLFLKNDLYVDRLTREMSNTQKEGTLPTNRYLYLPRNSRSEVENVNLTISFNGLGYSRNAYRKTYRLSTLNYNMGYCGNSNYCVNEAPSYNNNDLGKLITP